MPPRGHSHSSHSSSSRSSHSSSRSSSRSSSSHSSYRSSSGSSYGSYGSGWRGNARPSSASYRPSRTRTNQPTGYSASGGAASSFIRCHTHDYVYYPSSWTDPDTGKYYSKGYYDEDGKYYDKIVTKKSGHYETKYSCEYCGSEVNLKWDEGQQPMCPNCGAALTSSREWVVDEIQEETTTSRPASDSSSGCLKVLIIVAIIGILAFFTARIGINRNISNETQSSTETYDDSIYVNSIGREIYWNDAYDSYYDEKTDCYLVYNDEVDPPIWQYWYEGISSDYGDYGWMEWDYDEKCWYIESGSDVWDELPSKYYDEGRLWHF